MLSYCKYSLLSFLWLGMNLDPLDDFAQKHVQLIMLYCHLHHHYDTINKQTQEDIFINICTSHFIARVRKGYSRFECERELETEQKLQYFDPSLMAVSVVSFSFSWCSTGGPVAHSAGWWLSLLHLISIFSGPQLIRAAMAPSAWCGFTYHISSFFSNSNRNCLDFCFDWVI